MSEDEELRQLLGLVDQTDEEPGAAFVEALWNDVASTASLPRGDEPAPTEVVELRPAASTRTESPRARRAAGRLIAAAVVFVALAAAVVLSQRSDEDPVASETTVEEACAAFADAEPVSIEDLGAAWAVGDADTTQALDDLDALIESLGELEMSLSGSVEFDEAALRPLRLAIGSLRQAQIEAASDPDRVADSISRGSSPLNDLDADSRLRTCLAPTLERS